MHRKSLEAAEALKNEDSGNSDREDSASKNSDMSSSTGHKNMMSSPNASLSMRQGGPHIDHLSLNPATPRSPSNCSAINVTSPNPSATPTSLSPSSPSPLPTRPSSTSSHHHQQQSQHNQQPAHHQPPHKHHHQQHHIQQHLQHANNNHHQSHPSITHNPHIPSPPLIAPSTQPMSPQHHLSVHAIDAKAKELGLVASPHYPNASNYQHGPLDSDPEAFRWVDYNRDPISFIR